MLHFLPHVLPVSYTHLDVYKRQVKDKGKWSVLNNMEFMDRVRLQPEWYHYWIWYKKVLGIKIPLPGLRCV